MAKKVRRQPTTDAVEILYRRYIEGKPEMLALLEEAHADSHVACLVYDLRTGAGLSQAALARKGGTTAAVINQIEEADYEGHLLGMLRRIAAAVERKVVIQLVPNEVEIEGEYKIGPLPGPASRPAPPRRKTKTRTGASGG